MIDFVFILIGITILFSVLVALRSLSSFKACALCGAVSLTWITLLILFYLNYEVNPVLIGILMGSSVVGLMYLLEKKLREKYQIFKLPFFLTFISLAYFLIEKSIEFSVVIFLALIWAFLIGIHSSRDTSKLKMLGRKIIECCKNW